MDLGFGSHGNFIFGNRVVQHSFHCCKGSAGGAGYQTGKTTSTEIEYEASHGVGRCNLSTLNIFKF